MNYGFCDTCIFKDGCTFLRGMQDQGLEDYETTCDKYVESVNEDADNGNV